MYMYAVGRIRENEEHFGIAYLAEEFQLGHMVHSWHMVMEIARFILFGLFSPG